MAGVDFLFRGFTLTDDLQIKVQGKTRQRMIGVHPHQIAINTHHLDHLGRVAGIGLELHPHVQILHPLEHGTGHFADQFRIMFSVRHGRRHGHFQAIADITVFHRFLDAFDDFRAALQEMKRLTALGGVNELTELVLEDIMDG